MMEPPEKWHLWIDKTMHDAVKTWLHYNLIRLIETGDFEEVNIIGEKTMFEPGEKAPNDGVYMESGDRDFHTGIQDPKQVELKKGERFPKTSRQRRKWTKKNNL